MVDHGFEPWSCQTKDYKTAICCFSATLCIDGNFSTNINKINNYLSPQIIEHKKKKKNANRPGLGQTQKCGGVKRIQVTSAPNIVILGP